MIENILLDRIKRKFEQYSGFPDVFLNEPDEQLVPVAVLTVDNQFSPDKNTSGILKIIVTCPVGENEMLYEIISCTISCLNGIFITPEAGETVAVQWNKYKILEQEEDGGSTVKALIEFELSELPSREYTHPDPILAIVNWVKEQFPGVMIAGIHDFGEIMESDINKPVLYFGLKGIASTGAASNNSQWVNCTIECHVFALDLKVRGIWSKILMEKLYRQGEIPLPDKTTMYLENVSLDTFANPLKSGQIQVAGRYGIQKDIMYEDLINYIHFKQDNKKHTISKTLN